MGFSCRMFLLDQNDHLYRLTNTKFAQMLRDPARHRFPQFAGTRACVADAIVEVVGREPIRVIRITFNILTFDDAGCLDPGITPTSRRCASTSYPSLSPRSKLTRFLDLPIKERS